MQKIFLIHNIEIATIFFSYTKFNYIFYIFIELNLNLNFYYKGLNFFIF